MCWLKALEQGFNIDPGENDEWKPCSLEVVGVAVRHTALVGKLLILVLTGEPGIRDQEKDLNWNKDQDQDL